METPLQTEYKQIEVTGIPSVKLVERTEYNKHTFLSGWVVLILGPTGAGKSSFIEALASNTSLGISSNRLEGFTQSITAYQIIDVQRQSGSPIYLVDVPGFSDTKISEMKILSMLQDWKEKSGLDWFDRILYFMPINTPRLPGSQREVLKTFQALTGINTAEGITVVTTMWDCLWSQMAKQRGEGNFEQLRNEFWKDYIGQKAEILKFHNTLESALSILDHSFQRVAVPHFELQSLLRSDVPLRKTKFATNIFQGVQSRIRNLHMQLANIQSDLLVASEQGDEQLTECLVPQQEKAQKLLATFEKELLEFGDLPDS
ncbi:hypothetical protein BJ165DRAFT_1520082 [Panaeolus papilionaceus]|nr:hypothetical protein BJ165DRAFT_1520082 [Panaeolus papilionaceus]